MLESTNYLIYLYWKENWSVLDRTNTHDVNLAITIHGDTGSERRMK